MSLAAECTTYALDIYDRELSRLPFHRCGVLANALLKGAISLLSPFFSPPHPPSCSSCATASCSSLSCCTARTSRVPSPPSRGATAWTATPLEPFPLSTRCEPTKTYPHTAWDPNLFRGDRWQRRNCRISNLSRIIPPYCSSRTYFGAVLLLTWGSGVMREGSIRASRKSGPIFFFFLPICEIWMHPTDNMFSTLLGLRYPERDWSSQSSTNHRFTFRHF